MKNSHISSRVFREDVVKPPHGRPTLVVSVILAGRIGFELPEVEERLFPGMRLGDGCNEFSTLARVGTGGRNLH
jgi:hypothetical protein